MVGSVLQVALEYAGHGFKLVQVVKGEKRPFAQNWPATATSEPGTLTEMWEANPEADIGLRLGKSSGVIDVECDSPEAESELAAFLPSGLRTPCFQSTRGKHRLFAWQPGLPVKAMHHVGAIEVRIGNKPAQTVLPSPFNTREWIVPPGACPFAALPAELFAKITKPAVKPVPATTYIPPAGTDRRKVVDRAIAYAAKLPPSIAFSGGDATLWATCLKVVNQFLLDDDEAMQALAGWNARCEPPWDPSVLQRNIQNARGRGPQGEALSAAQINRGWETEAEGYDYSQVTCNGKSTDETAAPINSVAGVEASLSTSFKIESMTHEEFDAADFTVKYLIEDVLVEGQPFIIAGPSKSLKTSIALDLVFSLATATKFLGRFAVPAAVPVGIISGESGNATLRRSMREVARSRGRSFTPAPISWGMTLPHLSKAEHLAALEEWIRKNSLRVVLLDPAYLCLLAGSKNISASNVFEMGSVLLPLTELGQRTGCTIGLIHHFRKSSQEGRYGRPSLEDMSMSGFCEWARQWLLLARKSAYRSNGIHDLWLVTGGSAGHSGEFIITIDEGTNATGRKWDVQFAKADEAPVLADTTADRKAKKKDETLRVDQEKILCALSNGNEAGMTIRQLRMATGLKPSRVSECVGPMMERVEISYTESIPCRNGQVYDGYKLEFLGKVFTGTLGPTGLNQ